MPTANTPESQRGKLLVESNRAIGMVHDPGPAHRLRVEQADLEVARRRGLERLTGHQAAEEDDYLQGMTPGLEDAPPGSLAALRLRGATL